MPLEAYAYFGYDLQVESSDLLFRVGTIFGIVQFSFLAELVALEWALHRFSDLSRNAS